jgi:hypothetical protein
LWFIVWAPVGVLVSLVVDPDGSMDEPWALITGYPGFLGGVVFSLVLAVAARHRRLEELTTVRVSAWGALAGALVGTVPFLIGTPTGRLPTWLLATGVITASTVLSASSAAGTLVIARRGERRLGANAPGPRLGEGGGR